VLIHRPFTAGSKDRPYTRGASKDTPCAAGALVHVLRDRVAVALAISQGDEDVEGVSGQGPHGGRLYHLSL